MLEQERIGVGFGMGMKGIMVTCFKSCNVKCMDVKKKKKIRSKYDFGPFIIFWVWPKKGPIETIIFLEAHLVGIRVGLVAVVQS